jgi:hypothetical protein
MDFSMRGMVLPEFIRSGELLMIAVAVAKKPTRQAIDAPAFATINEVVKHCRRHSVSHNVNNGTKPTRYTLTRIEAKEAFLSGRADFVERKESADKPRNPEVYRAFRLRDKYAKHRDVVRKLCIEIHPWLHWGTKA